METNVRKAILAAHTGDRDTAVSIFEWFADLDLPYMYGKNIGGQAKIAAALGESSRAVTLLQDAFGEGYPYSTEYHSGYAWYPLKDSPEFQKFVEPAR